MQEHQVRRVPIVDAEDRVIGIVSQADLALHDKAERVSKTIAEISTPACPKGFAVVHLHERCVILQTLLTILTVSKALAPGSPGRDF
jgi:CBS-domain-containing membrane protein